MLSVFSQGRLLGNELDQSEVLIDGRAFTAQCSLLEAIPLHCAAQLPALGWESPPNNFHVTTKGLGTFLRDSAKMFQYGKIFCGKVMLVKRRGSQVCSKPGRESVGSVPASHTALLAWHHPDQQQPCCSDPAASSQRLPKALTSKYMWWELHLRVWEWRGQSSSGALSLDHHYHFSFWPLPGFKLQLPVVEISAKALDCPGMCATPCCRPETLGRGFSQDKNQQESFLMNADQSKLRCSWALQ